MIIEDFALVLRRRLPWEALDLGMVVAQRWRRPALIAWLATYGVCGACESLLVFWDWRLAWLAIWWSKPLFDRVLLYVYSHAVFGSVPTLGRTLTATAGFLATGQLWADLSFRRFSLTRSFNLPVTLLEGQTGRARGARITVLGRSVAGCATWLTFACANFVMILAITVIATLGLLSPVGVHITDRFSGGPSPFHALGVGEAFFALALLMLCETLIEPLYVASGFGLYLNRRSELEGWDLELAFRRMQRRAQGAGAVAALLLAALIVCTAWPLGADCAEAPPAAPVSPAGSPAPAPVTGPAPVPLKAGPASPPTLVPAPAGLPDDLDAADKRAQAVLRDPVFGHDEIQWVWQPRNVAKPVDHEGSAWVLRIAQFLGQLAETLAVVLGWGVRALLGIVLVLAIVLVVRWNWGRRRTGTREQPLATLFGLDIRPEALPDDVPAAARRLLDEGALAASLSLLYRACLAALVQRARIPFRDGDTEGRCLARVRGQVNPAAYDYFKSLVESWSLAAYAHRPPQPERIAELCAHWANHFGPGIRLESDA
jgi:hypothetical protein